MLPQVNVLPRMPSMKDVSDMAASFMPLAAIYLAKNRFSPPLCAILLLAGSHAFQRPPV